MAATKRKYASGWVRAVAEATDHDTAMKFALAFGGRRVRIPVKATEDRQLTEAVGMAAAEALVAKLGGEVFDVGLERRNLVFWLDGQDKSTADIANTLRMARRTVTYLLNDNTPKFDGGGWPEVDEAEGRPGGPVE